MIKRFQEDKEKVEKEDDSLGQEQIVFLGGDSEPKLRIIGIMREVGEDTAADVIYGLHSLAATAKKMDLKEPENEDDEPELVETIEPIELIINTPGGSADDMFAIYDTMREIQREVPVHTKGIGKVMSAGVPLLAAGTKGHRRIGENCRVMLHSVIGGHVGPMHQLDNEMEEIRNIQTQYINILARETNMTERYLRNLMKKKVNVYLSAQEAVDLGIADEII